MIASSRSRTYCLQVAPVPVEVEDRVADELARAVVRRLAAAVGLDDVDLELRREVQLVSLRPAPERHDRLVLEQEHRVRALPCLHRVGERALERERLGVRHEAGQVQEVRVLTPGGYPAVSDVGDGRERLAEHPAVSLEILGGVEPHPGVRGSPRAGG